MENTSNHLIIDNFYSCGHSKHTEKGQTLNHLKISQRIKDESNNNNAFRVKNLYDMPKNHIKYYCKTVLDDRDAWVFGVWHDGRKIEPCCGYVLAEEKETGMWKCVLTIDVESRSWIDVMNIGASVGCCNGILGVGSSKCSIGAHIRSWIPTNFQ